MVDLQSLLNMANSDNKKERKQAAQELGDLPESYPEAISALEKLTKDSDRGVRRESEKSLRNLSAKPAPVAAVSTHGGTSGTGFDKTIGDTSLQPGEFDYETSLSAEEEEKLDKEFEGKGLNVIVHETSEFTLDSNGKLVEKSKAKGKLTVSNDGSRDGIYGIDLELDNIGAVNVSEGNTALEQKMQVEDLGPKESWSSEYEFETEESPIEVTSKYYEKGSSLVPNFLGGREVDFINEINITNTSESGLQNLVISKSVNQNATIVDTECEKGDASTSGSEVTLKLEELNPGDTVNLKIILNGSLPEGVEIYKAGKLKIEYKEPKLYSGLSPKSIDGVSNLRHRIRRAERSEEPGVYDCVVHIENTSEFTYNLNTLKVFEGDISNQNLILDWDGTTATEQEREIQPTEKLAFEFAYDHPEGDPPTFGQFLDFSVQHEMYLESTSTIVVPEEDLKFMALAVSKEYKVTKVPSYTRTEIPTVIKVTGVGTYPLEAVTVTDEIPSGFEGPKSEEVVVNYNGQTLSSGYEVRGSGVNSTDTSSKRDLIVEFEHLENNDLVHGFKQDDVFEISYPTHIVRPEKDSPVLRGAVKSEGFIYSAPDQKVTAEAMDLIEGIEVVHERIAMDISKEVQWTRVEGQKGFNIVLHGTNFGNKTVNFTLKDLVPTGFDIYGETHETPQATHEDRTETEEGVLKSWRFEGISPDAEIDVKYTIVGSGRYDSRKAQVIAQG